MLADLLQEDVVRPNQSAWNCPIVVTKRKNKMSECVRLRRKKYLTVYIKA